MVRRWHTREVDLPSAFRLQATSCERLGSPLYTTLLEAAADDLVREGATARLLEAYTGDPVRDAMALRVMAGIHQAALTGAAPAVAAHYPTTGGRPSFPGCTDAFLATVADRPGVLVRAVAKPPQTNEIGRSAILVGGLLEITRLTGMPLRLLEIGASAGLNLMMDRFRYELSGGRPFGDLASSVVVPCDWRGSPPDVGSVLEVGERSGCDVNPLRISDRDDAARLRSFVWADQLDRFAQLERALELAARHPVAIAAEAAETWLPRQLASTAAGVATVVMHSVVMQYLSSQARRAVISAMRAAEAAATPDAPVAWLRFEPGHEAFELRLSLWPRGIDSVIAVANPHGRWVEWFIGTDPQ